MIRSSSICTPFESPSEVRVGAAMKVYLSPEVTALTPIGDVTVTSTVPADALGGVAPICVSLLTKIDAAGVPPKLTAVAPVKPVPVMTTP